MKEKMIAWAIGMIFERVSDDDVKMWLRDGLTMLQAKVLDSPNKWDDMIVLPLIKLTWEVCDLDELEDE